MAVASQALTAGGVALALSFSLAAQAVENRERGPRPEVEDRPFKFEVDKTHYPRTSTPPKKKSASLHQGRQGRPRPQAPSDCSSPPCAQPAR